MIALLKCSHCDALRPHALIRQDEHRNHAEEWDYGLEPSYMADLRAFRRRLDEQD